MIITDSSIQEQARFVLVLIDVDADIYLVRLAETSDFDKEVDNSSSFMRNISLLVGRAV
jgi:hypothetical protein